MITKRNLSPLRVVQYTAKPMAWAASWALLAPVTFEVTGDQRLVLPFAPVAALGAALAIFIAFRNNTAFGRWNEARVAWQTVLVSSRVLGRQIVAATENAIRTGTAEERVARGFARECLHRQIAYTYLLADRVRLASRWERVVRLLPGKEWSETRGAANAPNQLLLRQSHRIKDGIREGILGQFDPIALEPQFAALQSAQGVMERIKHTPTPRQYDYFTRRFIQLFAALVPFAVLSVTAGPIWWATPLSLALSGEFIVMAVVGAANDEPFEGRVTDVPMEAVCIEVERDLKEMLGEADLPPVPNPLDGYLW